MKLNRIREEHPAYVFDNDSNGLFLIPTQNVEKRPNDITDYIVTAANPNGKLQFTDPRELLANLDHFTDIDIGSQGEIVFSDGRWRARPRGDTQKKIDKIANTHFALDSHLKIDALKINGPQCGVVTIDLPSVDSFTITVKNDFVEPNAAVFLTPLEVYPNQMVSVVVSKTDHGSFDILVSCPKANKKIVNTVVVSFFILK